MRTPTALLRVLLSALLAASLGAAVAGCGAASDASSSTKLSVVADFYPVQFLADRVGGNRVHVTNLTPPGTEPHDLALTGKGRAAVQDADVVLYLGAGFQPDVEAAVAEVPHSTPTLDLLTSPALTVLPAPPGLGKEALAGNKDPHVWMDPRNMVLLAKAVATEFSKADPKHAATYAANKDALVKELTSLDQDYTTGLAHCDKTTIVTSHAAFGYLAKDYGLTQVPIAGLSPDEEPNPAALAKIVNAARAAGVNTVFIEKGASPKLSNTLASEIGAKTTPLGVMEFQPTRGDYVSVMRDNLAAIQKGLGCSA